MATHVYKNHRLGRDEVALSDWLISRRVERDDDLAQLHWFAIFAIEREIGQENEVGIQG